MAGQEGGVAVKKPKPIKRPKKCEECGIYYADPPSKLCLGCEAYQEHTAT